jgi:hypothetical protein
MRRDGAKDKYTVDGGVKRASHVLMDTEDSADGEMDPDLFTFQPAEIQQALVARKRESNSKEENEQAAKRVRLSLNPE